MAATNPYSDVTVVPRIAVRLPLALPEPEGFDVERLQTWPDVTGRLEYVRGRLEYMPPCGEIQQRTVADVLTELNLWRRSHPEFVVGGNEAGMLLGGEVRAADAAVWRAHKAQAGFARTAPVLAVEVTGADESAEELASKAEWYFGHGVELVWIVDTEARRVRVVTAQGAMDVGVDGTLSGEAALPGLIVEVAGLFRQI